MKYIVNYNNGDPEKNTADTLEEAMRIADKNVEWSGSISDITIEDENGKPVMERRWYGVEYDENNPDLWCEDPIVFGSEGYYSEWHEAIPDSSWDW